MAKGISIFFSGIILCVIMIKLMGGTTKSSDSEGENQISENQIKSLEDRLDKKYKDKISKLESKLASFKKPETTVSNGAAGLSEEDVNKLIKNYVDKSATEKVTKSPENITEQLTKAFSDEKTINQLREGFRKSFTDGIKKSLLEGIEVNEEENKQIQVVMDGHMKASGELYGKVKEELPEDATREQRRELRKEKQEVLDAEANKKIEGIFNDSTKFEQYTKNVETMKKRWGGRR